MAASVLTIAGIIFPVCQQESVEKFRFLGISVICYSHSHASTGEELLYSGHIPIADRSRSSFMGKLLRKIWSNNPFRCIIILDNTDGADWNTCL